MQIKDLTDKFVNDLSDIIKREAMSAVTAALLPPKPVEPAAPAPLPAKKKPGPKPGSNRKAAKKAAGKKGGK